MWRILSSILLTLIASTVLAKGYQGATWVDDVCYRYNGSSWEACTKNRYTGSAWEEIEASTGGCSGTELLSLHFENSDTITSGTPAGCTQGSDTTLTRIGITYSATEKSDGTYSAYSVAENSNAAIDTGGIIDAVNSGTWCGDVYYSYAGTTNLFDLTGGGATGQVIDVTNTIRIKWGAETSFESTNTIPDSTWIRICTSWDATYAASSDRLSIKIGVNAWEGSTNNIMTEVSNPTSYYILGGTWQDFPGYIDNVKLYSDYQHAE